MPVEPLREFEKQLDQYFKALGLYSQPQEIRLFALLAAYDFTYLSECYARVRFGDSVETASVSMRLRDSLTYCVRWLCQEEPGELKSPIDRAVCDSAKEFLRWGYDYSCIADGHMMYGKGLANIDIEAHAKKIRFVLTPESDERGSDGYLQTCEFQRTLAMQSYRKQRHLSSSVAAEISQIKAAYRAGGIFVSDVRQLVKPGLTGYTRDQMNPELLPLDPSTDLGGFCFGDYDRFWQALSNWSTCLLALCNRALQSGTERCRCAPTQLLAESEFVSNMAVLSGLQEQTILRIIGPLSYDFTNPKADILLQPFLRSNGNVLWSPGIIAKARHQRNLLKLMARTPELKGMADNIVGGQEGEFIALIGEFLSRKAGYQFKKTTRISAQTQKAEIDLIAYRTKAPSEVLVVEAKTLLSADEVNEVYEVTDKLIAAQGQCENALGVLMSMDNQTKQRLFRFVDWSRVHEYYPLLMTPDTHPDARYDDKIVPHISYASLRIYPRLRDLSKPSHLWSFCKSKEWIKVRTPMKQGKHRDIRVGDMTYSVPYMEAETSDNHRS